MAIAVAPTLATMAGVYREATTGGPASARFEAYVAAAASGEPIHGYNPMTSEPVLTTVEALLAHDAEGRLAVVANTTAAAIGATADLSMHFTVATPGMWTDRLATEVEHRLLGHDPGAVLWWSGDEVTAAALDAEIVAQTVRLVRTTRSGVPTTLSAAVDQEGSALAMAGWPGQLTDRAADALAVLGGDTSLSSMVAFLYGDRSARAMGFTPLGMAESEGYAHAAALCRERCGP